MRSPLAIYSLLLLLLLLLSPFTTATTMSMSSGDTMAMPTSSSSPSSTDTSPPYTITALSAISSAIPCISNCLIPIGLADASGCDDITENCACISAPAAALDFISGCIETVCGTGTSVSAEVQTATSLYESYCLSVYGSSSFSAAFVVESSSDAAAAASSSMAMTSTSGSSSASGSTSKSSSAATASITTKSGAMERASWKGSLLIGNLVIGGWLVVTVAF